MTSSAYKFETLDITEPSEFVYHVQINRPEKRNAMNKTFWRYLMLPYLLISDCLMPSSFDGILIAWLEINFRIISILSCCGYCVYVCVCVNLCVYFPCSEMVTCFNKISVDSNCRSVVLSGAGKIFTAGCR